MSSKNVIPNFDFNRYTSETVYREAVDAVLTTLSVNLKIPFVELHNGLFFHKGTAAKGMLVIGCDPVSDVEAQRIKENFLQSIVRSSPFMPQNELHMRDHDYLRGRLLGKITNIAPPEDAPIGRAEAIQDARDYYQNHWPEQLTSGIMFFKGERITKDEFDGRN